MPQDRLGVSRGGRVRGEGRYGMGRGRGIGWLGLPEIAAKEH